MSLLNSDGVVAYFLLNDCSAAQQLPTDPLSPAITLMFNELLVAAVDAGVPQAACDELRVWLMTNPACPRALVLAVAIGHAIPDAELNRITENIPEPPPLHA